MAIDKNADFTPSIPDSDVVPTKLPYNTRGGFKFWAQKVIPLVYNDSLSYYEVLCKVVNYLNNVIQNVDNLNESVNSTNQSFETLKGYVNTTKDTLINTYNELQDYVNTYFDNLDVQEEINAKLDAMADSGELTNLLAPFIPDLVTQWLNQHVTPTSPVIDDTLTISGAGADAKVTGDKITELKEDLNNITVVEYSQNLFNYKDKSSWIADSLLDPSGNVGSSTTNGFVIKFKVDNSEDHYNIVTPNSLHTAYILSHVRVAEYDANGTNLTGLTVNNTTDSFSRQNSNAVYFYIYVSSSGGVTPANTMVVKNYTSGITEYIPYSKTIKINDNALSSPIPTKTSELENDSGFITLQDNTSFIYTSENVFDPENTSNILTNKSIDSSGNLTDNSNSCVLVIQVDGIDGNSYQVYAPSSTGSAYVAKPARFTMYNKDKTMIGLLTNNTISPAVIDDADCKYLYVNVSKKYVTGGTVMILKNANSIILNAYDFIPYTHTTKPITQWNEKVWSAYGDSITAICNGDFTGKGWARFVNAENNFSQFYGRGIGGQKFAWSNNGGSVAFVNSETGAFDSRKDSYNKDTYTGSVPDGCVAIRSCFCSWDRITHMFPLSIKDDIDMVFVMGATNDTYSATDAVFVANDTTDPEWAESEYYSTYGGDFNITTLAGGIASTIMKMQAWMPNAVIVMGTPLNGQTSSSGSIRPDYIPDEYNKSIIVKDVANKYGCPVIDVFGTCGINVFNSPTYITDGTHPYNVIGLNMLARTVIGGLKTIYPMI